MVDRFIALAGRSSFKVKKKGKMFSKAKAMLGRKEKILSITSLGLELSIDKPKEVILVSGITASGPAALSGSIALYDVIRSIDGCRVDCGQPEAKLEKDIEAALNGGEGVPCYLTMDRKGSGTLGSRSSYVVCLRRSKPASTTRDKDVDRECDLGIVCSACDDGFIVSRVDRGGAAWLSQQAPPLGLKGCLLEGDTITSVDGKGTSSGFSMLRGPAWSRVTLSVTRRVKSKWMVVGSEMPHGVDGGEEDAAENGGGGDAAAAAAAAAAAHEDEDEGETYQFTLDIVRCPAMGRAEQVEAATSYREQISWLPALPAFLRTERRKQPPSSSTVGYVGELSLEEASKRAAKGDFGVLASVTPEIGPDVRWTAAAMCCSLISMQARLERRADEAGGVKLSESDGALGDWKNGESGGGGGEWVIDVADKLCLALGVPSSKQSSAHGIASGWVSDWAGEEDGEMDEAKVYCKFLDEALPERSRSGWALCWAVVAVSVKDGAYDSRARAMLRRMAMLLGVQWSHIARAEICMALELAHCTIEESVEGRGSSEKQGKTSYKRYAAVGGAAVLGGALIGITGGLAAPAVAAGLGVIGSAVGAGGLIAGATVLTSFGVVATAFGATGAGMVGYKMMRRTAGLEDFAFDMVDASPGLPVTIGVAGWLNDSDDSHWKVWDTAFEGSSSDGGETLALRWETTELRKMGSVLTAFFAAQARGFATTAVGNAVVGATFGLLNIPRALMGIASMIDDTWAVCQLRADLAGKELAEALSGRVQGSRPVTLVGYGMGARVIIGCLLSLSEMGAKGRGIVETAVCLGTPFPASAAAWDRASGVCSHRLVNGFSGKDMILSVVFRGKSMTYSVAGLYEVKSALPGGNPVLENIDLGGIVSSHWEYRDKLSEILERVGVIGPIQGV